MTRTPKQVVSLCPSCSECPRVEVYQDGSVRIGEEPAVVQLTREQWNELVQAVKTGLLKSLPLVAAAMLGSAALPAVGWTQQDQRPAAAALASGPQQIEMIVHGLSCPLCAYGLEKKLRTLEGLDSLSVDLQTGKVRLLVQDGSKATDGRLKGLVQDAGFQVVAIERSAPRRSAPDS